MCEFEDLHLILTEWALEGKWTLLSRCNTLECECVFEFTKHWILEGEIALRLRDDKWSKVDVELTRLMRLDHNLLRGDFEVVIDKCKLRFVNFNFLAGRVLNANWGRSAFTDWTDKLDLLGILGLFNGNVELVEDVFTSKLLLEVDTELVVTGLESKEIEFILLKGFTSNIKGVSSSDEEGWISWALNFPWGFKALSLLCPVLDFDDEVLLFSCLNSLLNSSFSLRCSCNTLKIVEQCCTVW